MSKLRGLFFSLGLVALGGLMAGEAQAETITLSVYAGTDTTVAPIYTITGGQTSVTANVGILNSDLAGAGFSAYSFSNLGGNSNNPGSTQVGVGAFLQTTGGMSVIAGGSGEGTKITIDLTEGGYTLPANGPSLQDVGQTTMDGLSSGHFGTSGTFIDATGMTTSTPYGVLTSDRRSDRIEPAPGLRDAFSLDTLTVLAGTSQSRNPTLPGAIGFVQTVSTTAVPEPASLVLMLTGMPLPLVVLGLLRRRRAAA